MQKKKLAVAAQILLLVVAFALTVLGIVRVFPDRHRVIVYVGQAITCIGLLIFGIFHIEKGHPKLFKMIINFYALFEAFRAALLSTMGVAPFWGFIAKFILAILAICFVVFSERIEKKECLKLGYLSIALEIALYVVFLVGFPGVHVSRINCIMPAIGVLIAGSIVLFRSLQENK